MSEVVVSEIDVRSLGIPENGTEIVSTIEGDSPVSYRFPNCVLSKMILSFFFEFLNLLSNPKNI